MAKAKYAAGSSTQSVEINSDRKLCLCFRFLGYFSSYYIIYVTYFLPLYQQFCRVENPFKSFDKLDTFRKRITCNASNISLENVVA